jgi:acyl-CoA synthetase (AMP-forming)/AMP-acid ligase II
MGAACIEQQIRPAFSSVVDIFRSRAATQADSRAYVFLENGESEGAALTYAELDARSRAVAAVLQQSVAPGGRALLMYPPGLEFIVAFLGCLYARVLAVPAYPPSSARMTRALPRLRAIAGDAEVEIVLCNAAVAGLLTALTGEAPELAQAKIVVTDNIDPAGASTWRAPDIGLDTLAFLQYTSGSTASPKGVMVSHGNLLHNLAYLDDCEGNDASSCSVSWLPVYHDMGLIEGVLLPAYGGYPAYQMAPTAFLQKPLRWLQAISRYRATNSGGPNFAYDLCLRKLTDEQRAGLDLSSWRVAYNGAEPIRQATLESFSAAFATCGFNADSMRPTYGIAESTLLVSTSARHALPTSRRMDGAALANDLAREVMAPSLPAATLVACGTPGNGTQVVIADAEALVRKEPGQIGEIWIAGPSVAQGYWRRPEDTARIFNAHLACTGEGPFLRTGDLGFFWRNELFITGRIKDTIIVRGRKLYPQDIEHTMESMHPAIRPGCSAAFSVPDKDGERLVVAAEVDSRANTQPADAQQGARRLIDDLREAIAEMHEVQAHAILLLAPGSLPKTSSGKIQRFLCRAGFLEGTLEMVAEWVQAAPVRA